MDNVPESIYNYRINKINLKDGTPVEPGRILSLKHISEPTRLTPISYADFCL